MSKKINFNVVAFNSIFFNQSRRNVCFHQFPRMVVNQPTNRRRDVKKRRRKSFLIFIFLVVLLCLICPRRNPIISRMAWVGQSNLVHESRLCCGERISFNCIYHMPRQRFFLSYHPVTQQTRKQSYQRPLRITNHQQQKQQPLNTTSNIVGDRQSAGYGAALTVSLSFSSFVCSSLS